MKNFQPNYFNIVKVAQNQEVSRLPLYEHGIGGGIINSVLGKNINEFLDGSVEGKKEYYRNFFDFYIKMGYDAPSLEFAIPSCMPGAGLLIHTQLEPAIKDREDLEKYPWDEVVETFIKLYDEDIKLFGEVLPDGMKAIGGPGYGIFECVQDLAGYMNLCYMSVDDPELYEDLFKKVGDTVYKIWEWFLKNHSDNYCLMRMGDDLGYKSNTLIPADDIRRLIIPQYKRIIELVHSYNKPFLMHSCGCIFDIMDDLIDVAKIDAKHSNEDEIARFPVWYEKYGDRIGNFGGIDTDAVCQLDKQEMKEYIYDVLKQCKGHGGHAWSSGNSIPDYVPVDRYVNMVEIIREYRKD